MVNTTGCGDSAMAALVWAYLEGLSLEGSVRAALAEMAHVDYPAVFYTGEYVVIPSGEQQTIPINGKIANRDITINPIPHNYGLVTWNGAFLTVS